MHFASGFNTASIKNWRGSAYSDESIEIFADCLKNCEKRRYYWKRLSDCNEKGGRKGGLKVFVPENYWGQKGKDWFLVPSFYGWGYNNYGIPVTFAENKNECYIFDEAFASVLSKEELIKLLKKIKTTVGPLHPTIVSTNLLKFAISVALIYLYPDKSHNLHSNGELNQRRMSSHNVM